MSIEQVLTITSKVAEDPNKTENTVTDKNPPEQKTITQDVNVSTVTHPDDSNKLISTLSEPVKNFNVKVIGPFSGEIEAAPNSILKDVLKGLNTEDDTFGRYKYRDEHGEPVSIMSTVDSDLVLTSVLKL
jgi:hypothetical protein